MILLFIVLIPIIFSFFCILPKQTKIIQWITSCAIILTSLLAFISCFYVLSSGKILFLSNIFAVDLLSVPFVLVIAIVSLICSISSIGYVNRDIEINEMKKSYIKPFYILLLLFVCTMYLSVLCQNLGLIWVSIEATTVISALLVGFYRKRASLEAAWKYIILCTVGIAFALVGLILIYQAEQISLFNGVETLNWFKLISYGKNLDPNLMKISFIFIIVGYKTKAGIFPMHTWLPDAHGQSPAPISALLSGVLLNCAVYAILRHHLLLSSAVGSNFFSNLLVGFGALSMIFSVPFILTQRDIKRLFAYSSVEHMGIILIGFGLGNFFGVLGAMLHMFNHSIGKSTLFLSTGSIVKRYGSNNIARLKGIGQTKPITSIIFLCVLLAIAGSPPFGLFLSETYIAYAIKNLVFFQV
ncbi:MAG: hydrogenase 4 subunit F [Thermodesulfobium narugense]|nr:MAG: hydrogenase 4 subunit F [Thermodesulfobium narugense]